MTNEQIILQEKERLFNEGKITRNKAGEYEQLHTFAIWKKLGYSVKKGEHAITTLYIWKNVLKNKKNDVKEDNKKEQKEKKQEPEFIKTKAFLFKASQVEKIDTKKSKKATTKKATTETTKTEKEDKKTAKKTTTKKATTKKATTKKDKKVEEYEQISLCDEIIKDINRYAR